MSRRLDQATRVADHPALRRALIRRYPGVKVELCERRSFPDCEGISVHFTAESAEVLVGYGLARRHPTIARGLIPLGAPETDGSGFVCSDHAYVIHHSYDGEPPMPGSRKYPPKWVVTEVERLMRRIRRAKRPSQPEPRP